MILVLKDVKILLMIYKKLFHTFLLIEGFSVGIGDMVADNKTYQKISKCY